MPSVLRFFKGGDPKEFAYRPRYYDPAKERRKQVEEEAKSDQRAARIDEEGLRDRMRASWRARETKGQNLRANIRLLVILILLCTLVWTVFLYLDRIPA